ncbi:hypothetical protein GC197_08130 [bacterium]|nr:hypothetical protein [bacterium]
MRTITPRFALSVCALFVLGCSQLDSPDLSDPPKSPLAVDTQAPQIVSLQIGEQPRAFQVEDVTGPAAGEVLCYRCKYGGKPTVVVFARELNDSVANLVHQLDQKVTEKADQNLSAFMVVVGDDPTIVRPELHRIQVTEGIHNTPLTIFDDAEGPPGYGLSPSAKIQVMMWNNDGVKLNKTLASHPTPEEISDLVEKTSLIIN